MGKITIEIDLDKKSDSKLMEIIAQYKTHLASGGTPENFHANNKYPSNEVGTEMNSAANDLANQIGDPLPKMNKVDRAKLGSKARWDKYYAEQAAKKAAGIVDPPKEKPKKAAQPSLVQKKTTINLPKPKTQDLSKAEEIANNFPVRSVHDIISNLGSGSQFPDGREIMEGNYDDGKDDDELVEVSASDFEEIETDDPLDDEYIQEVKSRAIKYEKEGKK